MIVSIIFAAALAAKPPITMGLGGVAHSIPTGPASSMVLGPRQAREFTMSVLGDEVFRINPDGTYRCTVPPSVKILSEMDNYFGNDFNWKAIYVFACGKNVTPLPSCANKSLRPGDFCMNRKGKPDR